MYFLVPEEANEEVADRVDEGSGQDEVDPELLELHFGADEGVEPAEDEFPLVELADDPVFPLDVEGDGGRLLDGDSDDELLFEDSDDDSVSLGFARRWLNRPPEDVEDLLADFFVSDVEDGWEEDVEFGEFRRLSDDEAD